VSRLAVSARSLFGVPLFHSGAPWGAGVSLIDARRPYSPDSSNAINWSSYAGNIAERMSPYPFLR